MTNTRLHEPFRTPVRAPAVPWPRPRTATLTLMAWAGLFAAARAGDDQSLIARAAADRPDAQKVEAREPAPARPASDAGAGAAETETLRLEAAVAVARLKNRLARLALQQDRIDEAARQAQEALELLRHAPRSEAVDVLELQAEGILAVVARAGATPPADNPASRGRAAVAAAEPVASAAVERAASRRVQPPTEDAVQLVEDWRDYLADGDRLVAEGWMSYPADWPERTARRAQHRGGLVHRGPGRLDAEGREWFVGVYDIGDLGYVPPDDDREHLDPFHALQSALDRDALRNQSMIFRGWPEDLAAGLPLLRYFGGVDDFRGHYSQERQAEVVRMLRAYMRENALSGPATRLETFGK